MSTAWYFHLFDMDHFTAICGNATPAQRRRLSRAATDPDETDWEPEDEEYKIAKRLVKEIVTTGISYAGKDEQTVQLLDDIVGLMFHRLGLEKHLGCRPISRVPLDISVAAPLATHFETVDGSLLRFLGGGRRFGRDEPSISCRYFIFDAREAARFADQIERFLEKYATDLKRYDEDARRLEFTRTFEYVHEALSPVTKSIKTNPSAALFGSLG